MRYAWIYYGGQRQGRHGRIRHGVMRFGMMRNDGVAHGNEWLGRQGRHGGIRQRRLGHVRAWLGEAGMAGAAGPGLGKAGSA
jgi:hypothetical protein